MAKINGKLSIIMPAYNEGKIIYNNIKTTLEIVEKFAPEVEVVAVNDGSSDNTKSEIIRAMNKDNRVKMVTSDKNHGKGAAILSGITQADGKYIAFVDADLELNPFQLEAYINKMENENIDSVIASKFMKESKLDYPLKRKIMSFCYYIMLRVLFHLKVRDTQTGLKVFRADAIKSVAHLIRTSGFAYDIEILVALNRRGYSIEQMPVEIEYKRERRSSRINIKHVIKTFNDTWQIFYRLYFKHYYDD